MAGKQRVLPAETAAWTFLVDRGGEFNVEVLQGCGTGQGGSEMSVVFDAGRGGAEARLAFTVEDTGGFQAFRPRVIGRLQLAAGGHTLWITPERIAKAAACDIREVRLLPAGPKESPVNGPSATVFRLTDDS